MSMRSQYHERPLSGLRVLVVEDDESALAVTVSHLQRLGVGKVLSANNGAKAVVMAEQCQLDLVVCDWNMPVISGLDVIRALRRSQPKLPIVMATGRADDDSKALANARGVDGYLTKPFSAKQLAEELLRAVAGRTRH